MPNTPALDGATAASDNEARLISIIQSAMDAIITIDESQRVIMFNPAAERIFGVPAAEAVGSPLDRFIPERFRKGHAEHVRSFGHTGDTMRTMGRLGSLTGLKADGTEFPIEASISHAVVGEQRLFTVILRDVSERKHLHEQLLQAQKMEGIGRLAGGIAHDFNNLLMAIFNYLTLATNRLEPEHPARPALHQVQEAANRAAMLTRQLLTFARKQPARPRILCPKDIVSGVEPMLRRLIGDDIILRTALDEDTGNVRADPTQIEQVLMNLVVNARDAMPQGGTLTISTANVMLDGAHAIAHPGAGSGPHVAITVTDTGHGMAPEVLSRLFEPFFTTKELGKGTGLGLATCHGIVRQSDGHISVQSAPGAGSSFRVLLPRIADASSVASGPQAPAPPARGTETVLVVEDSTMVRDLIAEAMRRAGYTVLPAPGGEEALRMAQAHLGPIHMLVTDVIMPGMSGVQLADTIIQRRGPIPVLFMSGGADQTMAREAAGPRSVELLVKPFATDTLLRRVRSLLDAHPRR